MLFTRKREYAFSGFFLFVLLKYHFLCPCDPDYNKHICFCILYILLPAVLCFSFTMVIACLRVKASASKDGCSCSKCCTAFLRALSMGLLWVIIVLFDGDWWVCLMTHSDSEADEQIACKQGTNLTKMDNINIRYHTNVSRVIALVFTLVMVPIWLCTTHQTKSSKQRHSEGQNEEEEKFL